MPMRCTWAVWGVRAAEVRAARGAVDWVGSGAQGWGARAAQGWVGQGVRAAQAGVGWAGELGARAGVATEAARG